MNTAQDILRVSPAAGLLSKADTKQMKAKKGTALDNVDPQRHYFV